jgi:hypothetical protein
MGGDDVVDVGLRSNAEAVARRLYAKYGDAVEITVGFFPFPPPEHPVAGCPGKRDVVPNPSPLVATLDLPDTIEAGSYYQGTVELVNAGRATFELETSSSFSVYLFLPGQTDPIGLSELGWRGVGVGRSMPTGTKVELPANGGTASCDLALGYALPPGTYEARALVDARMSWDPPQVAFFWTEATAVHLVAP